MTQQEQQMWPQQVWLVCGGRQFGNLKGVVRDTLLWKVRSAEYNFILCTLGRLATERSKCYVPDDNWLPTDIKIIAGAATGADSVAIDWATIHCCQFQEFPADWARHGKAAGMHRNQQMITVGKPTLGVVFPGGRGTADMLKRLRGNKIEVVEVIYTALTEGA